jgi:hypothetical protein
MNDSTPAPAATPEPQAGDGQTTQEQEQARPQLTAEELAAALKKTREEAAEYRRKLRDAEGKLTAAEKAEADAAEKRAAEQGKFEELYEAEKKRAAETEARLRQVEFDQQRRDAAQAAGISQLWQRLQGSTPEELADDAKALAAMMQPAQPANGQARQGTIPTPPPQGTAGMTPEERRARARPTF